MHVNYVFMLNFIRNNASGPDSRSLDYGCGAAEVVCVGRKEGLEVCGAEVFYKASNTRPKIERLGLLGTIVTEITDNRTVYADENFDVIVNNQVLEHVEDLDATLREFHRILKPGGRILSIFPLKESWWEGHRRIWLLHRFPRGSALRVYYAYLWRLFGGGAYKGNMTRMEWARFSCWWIDKYTFYRSRREILYLLEKYFNRIRFIENDYLLFRLRHTKPWLYPIFRVIVNTSIVSNWLEMGIRRRGDTVIIATKPS